MELVSGGSYPRRTIEELKLAFLRVAHKRFHCTEHLRRDRELGSAQGVSRCANKPTVIRPHVSLMEGMKVRIALQWPHFDISPTIGPRGSKAAAKPVVLVGPKVDRQHRVAVDFYRTQGHRPLGSENGTDKTETFLPAF